MTTLRIPNRILILDDDLLVGQMILSHVKHFGYEGLFTDDPFEFLEVQKQWQPSHVIVDLVMAKMDGLEVLSQLANNGTGAAVIISSGVGSRVLDAAKRFADAYGLVIAGLLPKPFTRSDLESLLNQSNDSLVNVELKTPLKPPWTRSGFKTSFLKAASAGSIQVAYQPKVRCSDGKLVGFEALARWNDLKFGYIAPAVFVPETERCGLAGNLSDIVLSESLNWFSKFSDRDLKISINMSAAELSDVTLDQRLLQACQVNDVAAEKVILELTETSAMEDPVLSLQLLTRLRLEGFSLSLDDFGTGYSSMVQLARLPFSEVKVDRSFVAGVLTSQESLIVTRSIIDLSHSLGLECTAEGVEDVKILKLLCELGCDYAQGFQIAKPMFAEEVDQWIAENG